MEDRMNKLGWILWALSAVGAQAAAPADHFFCDARMLYSRLSIEAARSAKGVQVTLRGVDAQRAAARLGLRSSDALQLLFASDACTFSSERLAVAYCQLNTSAWPPLRMEARSLNAAGAVVDRLELAVADLDMTHVVRTHVGIPRDYAEEKLEAKIFLISQKRNEKRAMINIPFELGECKGL
jgi:hypothetical protein